MAINEDEKPLLFEIKLSFQGMWIKHWWKNPAESNRHMRAITGLKLEPRRWQTEALAVWQREMRGVISVVTGGGKTALAMMCMERFRHQYPDNPIIIIVPTIALLDQWLVCLQDDLGVDPADIAEYSGQSKSNGPRLINVMVINTARKEAPIVSARRPNNFLIVDECHRIASDINALGLRGPHVATLGLSATPEREHDDFFERRVAPAIGDVVFKYELAQAIKDGVVSPFSLVNIRVQLGRDELHSYERLSNKISVAMRKQQHRSEEDYVKQLLLRRASVSAGARARVPVAARVAELNKNARIIIFHEKISAAESIHAILTQRGLRPTLYHSKMDKTFRRENLRLFRRGIYSMIVCCRALDEGLNVPDASVAIIASATASVRQRIQRLGRVLRPSTTKDYATVYTLYATDLEEERLRTEAARIETLASVRWKRGVVAVG